MTSRNEQIARRALAGERLTALAAEFGISPVRTRDVLHRWCSQQNVLEWYALKRGGRFFSTPEGQRWLALDRPSLEALRANAAQFTS